MNNFDENHSVIIENREKLTLTGVISVDEFDENVVTLKTTKGDLIIKGENLHIEKLNLDSYELEVKGLIYNFEYIDIKESFWTKIFK